MGRRTGPGYSRRDFLKTSAWLGSALVLARGAATARADSVHLDVPFHYQYHTLSCEMAALRMAAEYYGQVYEEDALLRLMPVDATQPRLEGDEVVFADPNRAFPGNYRGWQVYWGALSEHPDRALRGLWGYGVYAPVVARVAASIELQAEVFDDAEHVYRSLDRGWVPIAIVPDNGKTEALCWSWYTPEGRSIPAMDHEHAVVVHGYDDRIVLVHDPKGHVAHYERPDFERAFGLLRSGVAIGPGRPSPRRRFKPC